MKQNFLELRYDENIRKSYCLPYGKILQKSPNRNTIKKNQLDKLLHKSRNRNTINKNKNSFLVVVSLFEITPFSFTNL